MDPAHSPESSGRPPLQLNVGQLASGFLAIKIFLAVWLIDALVAPAVLTYLIYRFWQSQLSVSSLLIGSSLLICGAGILSVLVVWATRGMILLKIVPTVLIFIGALFYCVVHLSWSNFDIDDMIFLTISTVLLIVVGKRRVYSPTSE